MRIDGSGAQVEPPFASGVPPTNGNDPVVLGMLFDPNGGAEEEGSFWYVDRTSGTIQQRARNGKLLSSCLHPDHVAQPPASHPEARFRAVVSGVSSPHDGGFDRLDVSGGKIRDGRTTRILEMDTRTCLPTGAVIPTDDLLNFSALRFALTIHNTLHDGQPVSYVAEPRSAETVLSEIDAPQPQIPLVTDLNCVSKDDGRSVVLSFVPEAGLDEIEIRRDGRMTNRISATETSFLDSGAPPGLHSYSVRGVLGDDLGDDRDCSVCVGPGAILKHGFLDPLALVQQVAFDPNEDLFVVASMSAFTEDFDFLHFFDTEFQFQSSIESPFQFPLRIRTIAVRSNGPESEYFLLGMNPSSALALGDEPFLPVRVIDAEGRILADLAFNAPIPISNTGVVSSPNGMAWDSATDTFWLYEQNTGTVINFDLEGTELNRFPHPLPIHQDLVSSYGIAVAGDRNAIYHPERRPLRSSSDEARRGDSQRTPDRIRAPGDGRFLQQRPRLYL